MQYYDDLVYYMTLSLDPWSVGSMIWSIFWQPDIECNLVSPWLNSILSVLQPILTTKDLVLLHKVFSLRRPRVSLMWLGVCCLGDLVILDLVERYLQLLEERPYRTSMANPDITVAAWTGSAQSFWDEGESKVSQDSKYVRRADILQRRQNLRLRDDRSTLFSWYPFGVVPKQEIGPELLEYLNLPYFRQYVRWVWEGHDSREQHGFRPDRERLRKDVPDNLQLPDPLTRMPHGPIKVAPSKKATLSMLNYSIQDVFYDRSLDIVALPGLREDHAWLEDWRGLDSNRALADDRTESFSAQWEAPSQDVAA